MNKRNKELPSRVNARRRIAIDDVLVAADIHPIERNHAFLDFHDMGITQLRDLLDKAYLAGARS